MSDNGAEIVLFLEELSREVFEVGAGRKKTSESAAIVARHHHLFSRSAFQAENAALRAATSRTEAKRARLRMLLQAGYIVASESEALADEIADAMARTTFPFEDDASVTLAAAPTRLRLIDDPHDRHRFAEAWMAAAAPLRPLLGRAWQATWSIVAELSCQDYLTAYLDWKQLPDANWMRGLAETTLRRTEPVYKRLCTEMMPHAAVSPSAFAWWDVPALFRGARWDDCFPAAGIVSLLEQTALLFQPEVRWDGLTLDLEARPAKSSRPFCVGVRPPFDVRISISPTVGSRTYEEALHELGHALHYLSVGAERAWEDRYLGDNVLFETTAYLVASLLRAPEYLAEASGMPPERARDFSRFAAFLELFMIRRYCAKVLYEIGIHRRQALDDSAERYGALMRDALGFSPNAHDDLLTLDDSLYAFEYLLAWFQEAEWTLHLQRLFGTCWFRQAPARGLLRGLWSAGSVGAPEAPLHTLSPELPPRRWVDVLEERYRGWN